MKKFLFLMLSLICITAGAVHAADEESKILYYNDGYSDLNSTQTTLDGELCLKHKVDSSSTNYVATAGVLNPEGIKADKTIFSFDINAGQTNQYVFAELHGSDGTNSAQIASFFVSMDGKIGYKTVNGWEGTAEFPNGNDAYSGYILKDIEPNKWYHIDMIFNHEDGSITYYFDGSVWGTGHTFTKKYYVSLLNMASRGGEGYVTNPTGNEVFYLDNIMLASVYGDEMIANVGAVDLKKKTVNITFSEIPSETALSDIKIINTVTENQVAITDISRKNNIVTLSFSEDLDTLTEYAIEIPAGITGVQGKTKHQLSYFVTESGQADENIVYTTALEDDYDDATAIYQWNPSYSPEPEFVDEAGRGKVLGIKFAVKQANIETNILLSGLDSYFQDKDISTLSFDLKESQLRNHSFSLVTSGWAYPITLFTSEKGWFWGTDSEAPTQNGGNLPLLFPSTKAELVNDWGYPASQFADMQTDKWYNVKFELDRKNGKVRVYIDNTKLYEANCSKSTQNAISMLLVRNCSAEISAAQNVLFIDNFTIKNGEPERENKIKNTRFITSDGRVTGPFGKITRDLQRIDVEFYNAPKVSSITADSVKLFYGSEQVAYTVGGLSGNVLSVIPSKLPNSGDKVKLVVSGVLAQAGGTVSDHSASVTAEGANGGLSIAPFMTVKTDGTEATAVSGDVYAKTSVFNTGSNTENVIVSIMGYNGDKMVAIDFEEIELNSGDVAVFDETGSNNTLKVLDDGTITDVMLVVLKGGDTRYSILAPVSIER